MRQRTEPSTGNAAGGPYVPTVVFGVVLAAVAVLVALGQLTDLSLDLGLVLPVGMVVTGALLVAGALVSGLRRRR